MGFQKPVEIDQQELGELHQLINLHLYCQNPIIKLNLKHGFNPKNENYEQNFNPFQEMKSFKTTNKPIRNN